MARRRRRSLRRRVHHRRRVVAIVNDPGRRRRRRHASRNFGTRKGYRRGITRHVRRSGRRIVPGYRSISRNPGLSAYAGIRHRRRRHGRRNVRYSVRHAIIRRNPLKMGLGTFKELINKDFLIDAATVAGGALGTRVLTGFVLSKLNKTAWNSGVTGYACNLVGAGVLGALAGMLGKPRIARNLMLGGVASVVGQAANDYLVPKLPASLQPPAMAGMSGLGASDQVRSIVQDTVRGYLTQRGMGSWVSPGAGLGAYISPDRQVLSGSGMGALVDEEVPLY